MSTREIRISVSYGHLAIKVWNEYGQKLPILALHGWMDNAGTWDNLCPLIDRDYPIYALDFPGHGLSSHTPPDLGVYLLDNLVAVQKVIQHFKWKKIILLGHSMGGGISLLYSAIFPDTIEKVISIDSIRPVLVNPQNQLQHTVASLNGIPEAEARQSTQNPRYEYNEIVEKLVKSYTGNLTEDAAKILLIRNSIRHDDGKFSFTFSPLLKVKSTMSLSFEQAMSFLSNIPCDLLIIKASNSPYINEGKTKDKQILNSFKKKSNNFVFKVLEGGHHVHLVDPHSVAEVVNNFLYGQAQSKNSKPGGTCLTSKL